MFLKKRAPGLHSQPWGFFARRSLTELLRGRIYIVSVHYLSAVPT